GMSTVPLISIVDDDASLRVSPDNLSGSARFRVHEFSSTEAFLSSNCAHVRPAPMSGLERQRQTVRTEWRIPITLHPSSTEQSQLRGHAMTPIAGALLAGLIGVATVLLGADGAQAQQQTVKNIVLVHGAVADGSSWGKVIPILEARGFHVVAVQNPLTSLR